MKRSDKIALTQFVMCFLLVWFEQMLFNSCIADVFGLPHLTYWKMYGIDIFLCLLFLNSQRQEAYKIIIDKFGDKNAKK